MAAQISGFHGSDIEKIEAVYGVKKEDIINFSSNVNPLGISKRLKEELASHIDSITAYPDREYTKLRQAIASYVNTDYNTIITGNGCTELISLLIRQKAAKKALLLAPSYSEYEHEVTLAGGECSYYPLLERDNFVLRTDELLSQLTPCTDLLVLCNPNNPTSSLIDREDMRRIVGHCREQGIFVMVDETYMEFCTTEAKDTAISLTKEFTNLMVLRGISKFFAAPGLRLGYGVCGDKELLAKLIAKQNPWSINSLAAVAGEIMFSDKDYITSTKDFMYGERRRFTNLLSQIPGLQLYPAHANFVLVKICANDSNATQLFETAIRKGFMIRDCSTFASLGTRFFRICFLQKEQDDALLQFLRETF